MMDPEAETEEAPETATIPASLVAGKSVGDTITLTIDSIGEDGSATVSSAEGGGEEVPSGSDEMAAEFNQQPKA